MPLLGDSLSEPFAAAAPGLLKAAVEALRVLVLGAWPRIGMWKGEVVRGVGAAWVRVGEELTKVKGEDGDVQRREELENAAGRLKEVVGLVRVAVREGCEDDGGGDAAERGFVDVLKTDPRMVGLLADDD